MSEDWKTAPELSDAVPRVKRDNVASFLGTRRPPRSLDEAGAALVIDLVFGGRVVLYPLDASHFRVRHIYGHEEGER